MIKLGKFKILLTSIFLFISSYSIAQKSAYFERIESSLGVNANYINKLAQRKDGFIWIATSEGISRFDGYSFVDYLPDTKKPDSLPSAWAETIFEDSQQRLWVGTDNGLARLSDNEQSFVIYQHDSADLKSISGRLVNDIIEDKQNQLWFTSSLGLNLYQEATDNFTRYPIPNLTEKQQLSSAIYFAEYDPRFGFWVGTDFGLFEFDINTKTYIKHIAVSEVGEIFYDADFDQHGNLWLATEDKGVIKYQPSTGQIEVFRADDKNDNAIVSDNGWRLMVDSNERVWVGSRGSGMSIIDIQTNTITNYQYNVVDKYSIPSNLVTDFIQDNTGLVWVGTYDGFAIFQPNKVIENLRPIPYDKDTLSSQFVWSFAETEEALWVGTTEGLNREDKQTGKIEMFGSGRFEDNSRKFTAIWDIGQTSKDYLWLGTEFGLATFDLKSNKIEYVENKLDKIASNKNHIDTLKTSVWALAVNSDDSVWVGSFDGKLYRYSLEQGIMQDLTSIIYNTLTENPRLAFNNIIEDESKNLWLSTSTGFYHFNIDSKTIKPVLSQQGTNLFPDDWIYSTQHHKDDLYWVSTENFGLYLLKFNSDGTVTNITHLDQQSSILSDKNIYNIISVSESEAWLTGNRNLYEFNLMTKELTNFGSDLFLPDVIFHEDSQFYSSDGRVYFGSSNGLIRFAPSTFKSFEKLKTKSIPPIYLTSMSTNIRSYSTTSLLEPPQEGQQIQEVGNDKAVHKIDYVEFSHRPNVFNFEFSALNYSNVNNVKYSYRLQGFDQDWSGYSLRREITYTNLPAGDYLLQVRASADINVWGDNPLELHIKIHQAPWYTWQAYTFYSIIFLLLFYSIYRTWRKQLLIQYELNKSEVRLEQALWGSGDELWEWNVSDGSVIRNNCYIEFEEIKTLDPKDLSNLRTQIHPDDMPVLEQKMLDIVNEKRITLEAVYRRKTKDGKWLWLIDRATVTEFSSQNKPHKVSGTTRNINSLKKAEEDSRLLASAFQSSSDGSLVLDTELRVIAINSAFSKITNFEKTLVGTIIEPSFISSGRTLSDGDELSSKIMKEMLLGRTYNDELWIRKTNGRKIPVDLRMSSVANSKGNITHFIITITDIHFRKVAEKKLRKLANFDGLTGLPNRSQLLRQLTAGITQVKQSKKLMAVFFIDLDNFKNVNDSLGHSSGDALLIAVSQRLKKCVRREDTVARLGGDEFTIGLIGIDSLDRITQVAINILEAMRDSFHVENHELVISPSIGISVYGDDGKDIDTLLRHADIAMYHAKKNGRNKFEFFTQSMNERVFNRIALEKRVRIALEKEEFVLHYQPKFSLVGGHIIGFEALVRWQDPERGLVPPDEFIPIAEETGLILPLGNWVINAACEQLNRWNQSGHDSLNLAVNLSALQFRDKDLLHTVSKTLKKFNIEPTHFELEITESALIDDLAYAIKTLNELRVMGIKISLDDFGTGYSSLNYLKEFPIQSLKIDRSFVRDITHDKRDAKMVASIVSLAHNLDIRVIGEGVENREQLALLHQFGVDEGQGYFLGRPIEHSKASQLLAVQTNISDILKPIKF